MMQPDIPLGWPMGAGVRNDRTSRSPQVTRFLPLYFCFVLENVILGSLKFDDSRRTSQAACGCVYHAVVSSNQIPVTQAPSDS